MSLLNKKNIQANISEKVESIHIPKNDILINKVFLPEMHKKSGCDNSFFENKRKKNEITENDFMLKLWQNNGLKDNCYYKKNNEIISNKKAEKISDYFSIIRSTDTLKLKNNNIKSFSKYIKYNFHSLNYLKNSKRNYNKNISLDICTEINEKKENKISDNFNILTTSAETNKLSNSYDKSNSQKNIIISDEKERNKIKVVNHKFQPKFINESQQKNNVNNYNLTSINLKEKNITEKLDSKLIIYSKTNPQYKINKIFIPKRYYNSFRNRKNNFISMDLFSQNSMKFLHEDNIKTIDKKESFDIDKLESLSNINRIIKNNNNVFKLSKENIYDYIQSPIEFEYESDISSFKNTINNEEDIIQVCDKLKGVNFYEIQKKLTNIENSIVNYYDQMVEENDFVNDVKEKQFNQKENSIKRSSKIESRNKNNIILKNLSFIKRNNKYFYGIEKYEITKSKSMIINNKSYNYAKKILENFNNNAYSFYDKKRNRNNKLRNYIRDSNKNNVKGEFFYTNNNSMESTEKHKKINFNSMKLDQSEITNDSRNIKINILEDNEDNNNIGEFCTNKISDKQKSNNFIFSES